MHPWAIINGGINLTVFGDAAYDMPPLETIQESGVVWGFGSDGSRANQIRPFTTLWWAVTGKMVGGRQSCGRPSAASRRSSPTRAATRTRCSASATSARSKPGSSPTWSVLDRDYLTVPADQIKDITSVMTIVGGRVVHDAEGTGRAITP